MTNKNTDQENLMEKIVSLTKRRGFIFQGSEIYGGLAGTFDYGPLGLALKKNIENLWWRMFVDSRDDMYGLDSAILMNPRVWEASGHVGGFSDPLVEDLKTKKRYRADHLVEEILKEFKNKNLDINFFGTLNSPEVKFEKLIEIGKEHGHSVLDSLTEIIQKNAQGKSPEGNPLSEVKQFNMMFRTTVGSVDGSDTTVYMRPETAQGMFVNFKNILDSYHPKLPFGIAQVGRNFRNEIAPRDFIFRVRELEIMEFEYFIREADWQVKFEYWQKQMREWFAALGFAPEDIREIEIPDGERAHYSKRTVDFHFRFPHKFDEIGGLAYRTDFDLKNHITHSGAALEYLDPVTNEKLVPHVLEPTFGLGRHLLAVLSKSYTEDTLGGETRVYLKFPPHLAPIKAAVFPLLKNKPELVAKAREIYESLKKEIPQIMWDDNGNVGKRYRRQDEIGTPFCITVDFETLGEEGKEGNKDTVTVRDRDTGTQERISIAGLNNYIKSKIS